MINECNGKFVCQSPNEMRVASKENLLEKLGKYRADIDELRKKECDLWEQHEQAGNAYIDLFKAELINRNIKGKCFVMIRDIHDNTDKIKRIEYFRILEVEHVCMDMVYLTCDFFYKNEMESKILFKFGIDSISMSHEAISENNELSLEEFYKKRDEFWDEYKTYMK